MHFKDTFSVEPYPFETTLLKNSIFLLKFFFPFEFMSLKLKDFFKAVMQSMNEKSHFNSGKVKPTSFTLLYAFKSLVFSTESLNICQDII